MAPELGSEATDQHRSPDSCRAIWPGPLSVRFVGLGFRELTDGLDCRILDSGAFVREGYLSKSCSGTGCAGRTPSI